MTNQLSQIKWVRTLLTAFMIYILGFLAIFIVITVYAAYLAFQARGAPDQAMIMAFANQHAAWIGPLSLILFTFLGTRWLLRRAETAIQSYGIVLGILVSLINIALEGTFNLTLLITSILTIVAGWLGTQLSARK